MFAPALVGHLLLAPDDGYRYYLPIHELTAQAWHAGHVPGWNPFQLSGSPLLATQAGAFYPLELLYLVLPDVYANNLYIILSIAIAALGAAAFARRLTGDIPAAVVAGLGFGSSGFIYGHIAHQPIVAGAAWIPWALLGYDRVAERRSAGRFVLAAIPLAMPGLTGHPQMFFVTIAVVAAYAFFVTVLSHAEAWTHVKRLLLALSVALIVELVLPASPWVLVFFMLFFALAFVLLGAAGLRRWLEAPRKRLATFVWLVPAVVLLGGALAAPQLIPMSRVVHETIRSQPGIGLATSFSFSPSHLILLAFPYLFGNTYAVAPFHTLYRGHWNLTELTGYPGLAALVFAVAGWPRIRRDARAVALGLVAGGALVLALGRSTGVGGLVALTPVFGQLRAWGRYMVIVDLAIAIFAAFGVAHLRSARSPLRAQSRAWWTVALLALVGIVVPSLPPVHKFVVGAHEHVLAIALPLAAAAAAASMTFLLPRFPRLGVCLCCLLVAADGTFTFGAFFEWRHSPSPQAARRLYSPRLNPSWGAPPVGRDEINRFLFAGRSNPTNPYLPQVTDLKGLHSASGYEPLLSRRYSEVVGGLVESGWMQRPRQFVQRRSPVLDILRISTVLVPARHAPAQEPPWFSSSSRFGQLVRYTYEPRLSSAYIIGRVRRVRGADAAAIARGIKPFNFQKAAVVEGHCDACTALDVPGLAGRVARVQWGTNSVDATITARRRGLLVLSQSWFPGWSASVDGHATKVLRTNALVLGVLVPPGRHHVRLSYRTPGLTTGLAVSGGTLAGFALVPAFLLTARRRRRLKSTRRRQRHS